MELKFYIEKERMIGEKVSVSLMGAILYIGIVYVWGLLLGILFERTRENNRQRRGY